MGTTTDKLNYLLETKSLIKEAIEYKGQAIDETDTFRDYADRIKNISTTSRMNVYVQPDEPEDKEGIWIKNDTKISDYDIIFNTHTSTYSAGWSGNITLPLYVCSAVGYKEVIYLFGYDTVDSVTTPKAYIYNPIESTFTELPQPPVTFSLNTFGIVGTKIYLSSGISLYTFDIETKVYEIIGTLPITPGNRATLLSPDGYIYLAKNNWGGSDASFYKYNINTGESTKLANIQNKKNSYTLGYYNGFIYAIGGQKEYSVNKLSYRYNTATNSWSATTNTPVDSIRCNSAATAGNSMYIFGGWNNSGYNTSTFYKFNMETASFSSLTSGGTMAGGIACTVRDNEVYNFSFSNSSAQYAQDNMTKICKRYTISKRGVDTRTYDKTSVVIYTGTTYNTELATLNNTGRNLSYFADVGFYIPEDGFSFENDMYIGDGTSWAQIK